MPLLDLAFKQSDQGTLFTEFAITTIGPDFQCVVELSRACGIVPLLFS